MSTTMTLTKSFSCLTWPLVGLVALKDVETEHPRDQAHTTFLGRNDSQQHPLSKVVWTVIRSIIPKVSRLGHTPR